MILLENVVGLCQRHKQFFLDILLTMKSMGYTVAWDILDSRKVGGVPQSRRRLYHVGIFGRCASRFVWPSPIDPTPLDELIDDTAFETKLPAGRPTSRKCQRMRAMLCALRHAGCNYRKARIVCDLDGRSFRCTIGYVPCLTKARAADGFWLVWKGRRPNTMEMLRLQGKRRPETLNLHGLSIRRRKIGQMIGNAFTESVVGRVMIALLDASGLTGPLHDPWKR